MVIISKFSQKYFYFIINFGMYSINYRRHRSTSEDMIINNPDLCYKNVTQFKRLLDALHYKRPVVSMTDCTKLKAGLQYSSNLGCIVRSTLDRNNCMIETYDDIYGKVSNIKQKTQLQKMLEFMFFR